jgi:hypothetical protein
MTKQLTKNQLEYCIKTQTKPCNRCGEVKTFNEFNNRLRAPLGIDWNCKVCHNKIYKDKYAAETTIYLDNCIKTQSRKCTKCNKVKPFSEFRKINKGGFPVESRCKKCRPSQKYMRRSLEQQKKYRENYIKKYGYSKSQLKAKKLTNAYVKHQLRGYIARNHPTVDPLKINILPGFMAMQRAQIKLKRLLNGK